jgi:hypothetical protein
MLKLRKLALWGLATSVALPLLYVAFIETWAHWHYYRRGLPFDGIGAAAGIALSLGASAVLCAISFFIYALAVAKERRFGIGRALETCLFVLAGAIFLSALYWFLQIRLNFVAAL